MVNNLPPLQNMRIATSLILNILFSGAFAIGMGFVQLLTVKWVVKMNIDSVDRASFWVNTRSKAILHKLGTSFLDVWSFSRERDLGKSWLLKKQDESDRHIILEIGPHPDDSTKAIVASIAFEISGDWIIKSDSASNKRDIIINNIEKRIGTTLHKLLSVDDSVSRLAYGNVNDLSKSRIEITWQFFKKMPKFYKWIISINIIALGCLFIAFFYELVNISFDTYIGTTLALLVALFIELGFPLRNEVVRKKREDLDFE